MASLDNRLKKLEQSVKESTEPAEYHVITISKETYQSLDPIQQLNLPLSGFDDKPMPGTAVSLPYMIDIELTDEDRNRQNKILNGELEENSFEHFENTANQQAFDKAVQKHGGVNYEWTEERMEELKAGRIPS